MVIAYDSYDRSLIPNPSQHATGRNFLIHVNLLHTYLRWEPSAQAATPHTPTNAASVSARGARCRCFPSAALPWPEPQPPPQPPLPPSARVAATAAPPTTSEAAEQ